MPSFSKNFDPLLKERGVDVNIHNIEMEIIKKYSPFRTDKELDQQFRKIKGESGSLFVCYNLQLMDNGQPEFDIVTDPTDIKIALSTVDPTDRK